MKTILKWALVSLMTAQGAQAMVVDKLDCSLSLTDLASGRVTKSAQTVRLVRGHFDTDQPNAEMTRAFDSLGVEVDDGKKTIFASGKLFFFHAVKFDTAGHVIDSRQQSCAQVTGGICEKNKICSENSVGCNANPDPFDIATGWQKVKLISNTKIPEFDARSLNSLNYSILDKDGKKVATTNMKCTYSGTIYDAPSATIEE